ncbi:MAG TPA: cation:proton antiporter [Terriglobales bacterium]|jgi:cell volume regulation protein A
MPAAFILGLIGGLLILAFVANRIFRLTRIPDIVVLMALGVLLGPAMHLVDAERFSKATNLLGTIAIILVLFEGGLELDLRETLRHFRGSLLLAIVAYVLSTGLVALIVCKGLGLSLTAGLLVGAALGCTSSTVVLPVLQQMQTEEPVRITLMLEASWGDVLAVLTVGLLISMQTHSGSIAGGVLRGVFTQVVVATLFSVVVGILWSRLLRVLSEQRFWQVLTFSIVLILYAGMESLGANGLIAVLMFGLTLANFPGIDPDVVGGLGLGSQSHQSLLTFHSELAFLVRTFFFVLIGLIADIGMFRHHPLLMAGTLGALFLARWISIQMSRWAWHDIGAAGRDVILWMLPRGLITVVLAIEVTDAIGKELSFLPGLAFAVILATNLLVVFGSWRARRRQPAPPVATTLNLNTPPEAAQGSQSVPESLHTNPQTSKVSHRWILDAALLLLLAFGGMLLWVGNQPVQKRPMIVKHWMQALRERH